MWMWCKKPTQPSRREGLAFTQNQKIEESLNVWSCHKAEVEDMKAWNCNEAPLPPFWGGSRRERLLPVIKNNKIGKRNQCSYPQNVF